MVTYQESPWTRQAFMKDSSNVRYGVAVTNATVNSGTASCEAGPSPPRGLYTNTEEDARQKGCGGYAHDAELAPPAAPIA
eukprot:6563043-Pyramimonas_sp.AAC.1